MYTLAELARHLDGRLHGYAKHPIQGVASLSRATKSDLAYFDNTSLLKSLTRTEAGAVLLMQGYAQHCPVNYIVVANPLLSMTIAAEMLVQSVKYKEAIHPTALISPSAILGTHISIGANSYIGEGVRLDNQVQIGANCVLEAGVAVGEQTIIHSGVCIHGGTKIGANSLIESGVVLGASPFNSVKIQGRWCSGPAVGGVIVEDKVQIGANTVVDRGSLSDTYIGEGVYIDDLVQIAHDVTIGANTAVAGCAAIGAYTKIGAHCIIGGASCVAAHVHIVDDVVITGASTVNKSLNKAGIYSSGIMVSEHQRWRRNAARFRRLDDYIMRLTKLEKECSKAQKWEL